jgi:Reverse transcriptase (RNA-dependent DNA polymerase)
MIQLPVHNMLGKVISLTQPDRNDSGELQREKNLKRMTNQSKLMSYQCDPFWKFGALVPCNHAHAVELDKANGTNTKWQDAEATEMNQIMEYNTWIDKGIGGIAPKGHKKIRFHMTYDIKHDGYHKGRLVAGGHLKDPNTESVYSGLVSLRGIRLIVYLAELNKMELWGANVGNAYLEAMTKYKVYIIGGPEFGNLAGHPLCIFKAIYGLISSDLCWHQHFADVLRDIGSIQSKVESNIRMRASNGQKVPNNDWALTMGCFFGKI